MSRRKSVISTYGRHRNRVVTLADPWCGIGETNSSTRTKVFNSSESSNESIFSINDSASLAIRVTRSTRKANKENRPRQTTDTTIGTRKRKQKKAFSFSDSNSGHDSVLDERPRRALRDRSNASKTGNAPKRANTREERPKALARNRNITLNKTQAKSIQNLAIEIHDSSVENFSEFEGYSLIISDSPAAKKSVPAQRGGQRRGVVSTSTPDADRPQESRQIQLRSKQAPSQHSILSPRVVELRDNQQSGSKSKSNSTSATKTPESRSRRLNSGSKSSISTSTPHLSHVESLTSPAVDEAELSNISSPISCDLSILNGTSEDIQAKIIGCSVALQKLRLGEVPDNFHTPVTECRLHGHNGVNKTPTGGTCLCDVDNSFSDCSQRLRALRGNLSAVERSIELSHITDRRGHSSASDSSRDTSNITERNKPSSKNHIDTSFITERPHRAYNTRAKRQTKPVNSTYNDSQQSLFDDSYDESMHMQDSFYDLSSSSKVLRSGKILGVSDHGSGINALESSHHGLFSINERIEEEEEDEDEEEEDEEVDSEDDSEEENVGDASALSDIEECSDEEEDEMEDSASDDSEDDSGAESATDETGSADCTSTDVTRYMLASNPPSTDSSAFMTPDNKRKPAANRLSCLTPGRMNSTGRNLTRSEQLINEDLELSCHPLKALTPVKNKRTGRVLSDAEKVLQQCHQQEPVSFEACIPPVMMKKCVKIGEGVYGEVFRSERDGESIALKIIPIEGDFPVNDEPQKTYAEILPEIVISKELSDLALNELHQTFNFVQVNSVAVVEGCYPPTLLKQWDLYNKKKGSENDRPDIFTDEQLFIIFEFEDSGHDLESFQLQDLHEARSVLHQVTCSLAIAEQALQFEHRDLHWGNVLVKRTTDEFLSFQLEGSPIDLESQGMKVAIIDFTLSRLSKDGCHVFTDLSCDPTLFEGHGDYQFDVYRKMKEENGNEWEAHHPYTNVLWIHYLADKLLHHKRYKNTTSKEHKMMNREFRSFIREATDFRSALHLLHECSFFQNCSSLYN